MAEQKNTYPARYADAEYANVNDPDMNNQEFPYQGQGYQDLGYQDLDSQQFAEQDLGYQSESRYRDPRSKNSEYTDAQLLGLQGGPTASGVTNHLNRLAMHLVYGVATAATTQTLRRLV